MSRIYMGDTVKVITPRHTRYGQVGLVVKVDMLKDSQKVYVEFSDGGKQSRFLRGSLEVIHGFEADFDRGCQVSVKAFPITANGKRMKGITHPTVGMFTGNTSNRGSLEIVIPYLKVPIWLSSIDVNRIY